MINLEHLTEEERNIILDVLRRDEALRQAEQDRVKKLKTELHELRKKSAVKVDDENSASASSSSNKNVCARCREPLGTLFGSGEVCSRCQHKVCGNCKVFLPSGKKWLCTVCNKQFQIRLGTGEIPGIKREEGKPALYGTELVKASLTQTAPKGSQQEPKVIVTSGPTSPADSGYNGRRANISYMGESTEASTTTYDDEYPSDASYDHSAASGVESIGPSVSQRGGVVRRNEDGTLTRNEAGKHYVSDSENEVSLDLARTAEITLEPVSAADVAHNHATYHSDTDEVDNYHGYSPASSRRYHGNGNYEHDSLSDDNRTHHSRDYNRKPVPKIAIQDAGDVASDEEYYGRTAHPRNPALEATQYREGHPETETEEERRALEMNSHAAGGLQDVPSSDEDTFVGVQEPIIDGDDPKSEDLDEVRCAKLVVGQAIENAIQAVSHQIPEEDDNQTFNSDQRQDNIRDVSEDGRKSGDGLESAAEKSDTQLVQSFVEQVIETAIDAYIKQQSAPPNEENGDNVVISKDLEEKGLGMEETDGAVEAKVVSPGEENGLDEEEHAEDALRDGMDSQDVDEEKKAGITENKHGEENDKVLNQEKNNQNMKEDDSNKQNGCSHQPTKNPQHARTSDALTGEFVTFKNGQIVRSEEEEYRSDETLDHSDHDATPQGSVVAGHKTEPRAAPEITVASIHVETEENSQASAATVAVDDREKEQDRQPEADHTYRSSAHKSVTSPVERKAAAGKSGMLSKGSSSSLTSLYSTGEEFYGKYPITGDINFGLNYNFKTNVFEVKVVACRDLVPIDTKKTKSDPYVKAYLLPDKSKNSKRKTKTKKGTINPQFNESLKYNIAQSELETRTLSVAVWHNDRFGHNMFLGEVTLQLDSIQLSNYPHKWHQLMTRVPPTEKKPMSYKGDLVLALMFETSDDSNASANGSKYQRKKKTKQIVGSLKLHIKEGKNLASARLSGTTNPYVKAYLEPDKSKGGKKKTAVMKNTINPVFEQSFEFPNMTEEILKERALEVGVWDHDPLASHSFLGGVRLGMGTGKSYGRSVPWQDSTGMEIQLWEQMMQNHNHWVEACLTLRPSFDKKT